jgi:hypothetical protein
MFVLAALVAFAALGFGGVMVLVGREVVKR